MRRTLSHFVGWLADRRLPRRLRAPVYRAFARYAGADLDEVRIPLVEHPSLGAFFVRRLAEGLRPMPEDPAAIASPVDGTVQTLERIRSGTILQAKGRPYSVAELIGDADDARALEGGRAWTIYLGPKDYHRIHAPFAADLTAVRWIPGARYSVAPSVLLRRPVLAVNERAVLQLDHGAAAGAAVRSYLVCVGALNVGRIRVVGVERGASSAAPWPRFERGAELARFELGSTIVLLVPPSLDPSVAPELAVGDAVRLGRAIGRLERGAQEDPA